MIKIRTRKINLNIKHLIAALTFLISTAALIIYFPPTHKFPINNLQLPILYPFFISLFLSIYFLTKFILRRTKHALLLASFTTIYLLFRLNNLANPLFFFLLLGLFLVAEILFTKNKPANHQKT